MEIKPSYVKMMLLLTIVLLFVGAVTFLNQKSSITTNVNEGFATEEDCFLARSVYLLRYPDARNSNMSAFQHYKTMGKTKKYIWPSCTLTKPTLSFCPIFAPQIQTTKGNTDCCQGEMIDGKCNGTTFCTLSPAHDGVPNCIDAWKNYFLKKAESSCPSTMPFYFEDVKKVGGIKGCSSTATNKEGTGPERAIGQKCIIYPTDKENREKADSCYIERQKLLLQCPVFNGIKGVGQIQKQGNRFQYYTCNFSLQGGLPQRCFEDKTVTEYLNRVNPNWRNSPSTSQTISDFCSNFVSAQRRKEAERKKLEEERRKREALERALRQQREAVAKAERERKALLDARKRAEAELIKARQQCNTQVADLNKRLNRLR